MISINSAFGILMALFIPGFFVTFIFFRGITFLERIVLSFTFSIMIATAIGIALGYDKEVKDITGGVNSQNVWKWELAAASILGIIALLVNVKNISLKGLLGYRIKPVKLKREKEIVRYRRL